MSKIELIAVKAFWDKTTGEYVGKGAKIAVLPNRAEVLVENGYAVKPGKEAKALKENAETEKANANADEGGSPNPSIAGTTKVSVGAESGNTKGGKGSKANSKK